MPEPADIVKVADYVSYAKLKIPEYQRPYKWTLKNVNQLVDDILYFKDKKSYRLGTVVIHKDDNNYLNIVDGQQRTITLFLILLAIKNNLNIKGLKKSNEEKLESFETKLQFSNRISQYNIQENYSEIRRRVIADFDTNIIEFLLEKCEFVVVTLNDISEAFQFFDSQNARGKDLEPHDLLKAFHLREMDDNTSEEKAEMVQIWEAMNQSDLSRLFGDKLFRIRNWSQGNSARYFTKNDVSLFKGISINSATKSLDPYARLYQMANVFVDNYNNSSDREIDNTMMTYPFQLDLPILNGKRFFEMVSYYSTKYSKFKDENEIIKLLNTYDNKNRTGDKYIRMLFDCALIFYVDKFGEKEIDKVIEKLFVWAYSKRLTSQAVYLATIDKYALESKVFKTIKNANSYKEVTNMRIKNINKSDIKLENIDEDIENKVLGY